MPPWARPVRLSPPGRSNPIKRRRTTFPPGTGRYKVLQILDDQSPGGIGWDYERFS